MDVQLLQLRAGCPAVPQSLPPHPVCVRPLRCPPAAANAFLKRQLGPAHSARLVGVKDMPRGSSRLSLDFSSLLGPLFSMWLLQVRPTSHCHLPPAAGCPARPCSRQQQRRWWSISKSLGLPAWSFHQPSTCLALPALHHQPAACS